MFTFMLRLMFMFRRVCYIHLVIIIFTILFTYIFISVYIHAVRTNTQH